MRSVTEVLGQIRQGAFVASANTALADVVQAVMARKAIGTITIELKIKPDPEPGVVEVQATYKTKIPQGPALKAIFFVGEDGDLRRDDPRQGKLGLADSKTIDGQAARREATG